MTRALPKAPARPRTAEDHAARAADLRVWLGLPREDWPAPLRAAWHERAALLEFDAALPRPEAERRAEQLVRDEVARRLAAPSVTPVAAAVATGTSGNGPHRRP